MSLDYLRTLGVSQGGLTLTTVFARSNFQPNPLSYEAGKLIYSLDSHCPGRLYYHHTGPYLSKNEGLYQPGKRYLVSHL